MSCSDKLFFARASSTIIPPLGGGEFSVADWVSPHFWYMVVADCSSEAGLDFDYYVEWYVFASSYSTVEIETFQHSINFRPCAF
jgi:hypothetical protein